MAVLYRSWFHDGTIPESYPSPSSSTTSTSGSESEEEEDLSTTYSIPLPLSPLPQHPTTPSSHWSVPDLVGHSTNSMSSSSSSLASHPATSEHPFRYHPDTCASATPQKIELTKVYLTPIWASFIQKRWGIVKQSVQSRKKNGTQLFSPPSPIILSKVVFSDRAQSYNSFVG